MGTMLRPVFTAFATYSHGKVIGPHSFLQFLVSLIPGTNKGTFVRTNIMLQLTFIHVKFSGNITQKTRVGQQFFYDCILSWQKAGQNLYLKLYERLEQVEGIVRARNELEAGQFVLKTKWCGLNNPLSPVCFPTEEKKKPRNHFASVHILLRNAKDNSFCSK